jgi:hypothetical protein
VALYSDFAWLILENGNFSLSDLPEFTDEHKDVATLQQLKTAWSIA